MIRLLFLWLGIVFPLLVFPQETPGKTFGGDFNDVGYTVGLMSDGGYLLAGKTRISKTVGEDMLLIRLNQNGDKLWQETIGWNRQDMIRSLVPVQDGFVMVGDVWEFGLGQLDICLVKTDLYGNKLWHKLYGTNARDMGFNLLSTNDGGYLILGHSRGYENAGDLLLIKTNHDGEEIWRKSFGSEHDDYGIEMIQNEDGSIVIVGSKGAFYNDVHANFRNHDADVYLFKIDQSGSEVWRKTIGGSEHDFGYSIAKANDGGYFVFGSTQSYGNGNFDMMLAKTDDWGDLLWHKTFGGVEYDMGISMAKNANSELYLLGSTKSFGIAGSSDTYLIKTDDLGNEIWTLTIGGEDFDKAHKVIATPDSGCVVVTETQSFGSGMSDILFTKVNSNGFIEYFISNIDSPYVGKTFVYPMPLKSKGRVKIENSDTNKVYTMEIISLSGIHSKSFVLYPPVYGFDIGSLTPGLYLYRITSEDNSSVFIKGKLIVQ